MPQRARTDDLREPRSCPSRGVAYSREHCWSSFPALRSSPSSSAGRSSRRGAATPDADPAIPEPSTGRCRAGKNREQHLRGAAIRRDTDSGWRAPAVTGGPVSAARARSGRRRVPWRCPGDLVVAVSVRQGQAACLGTAGRGRRPGGPWRRACRRTRLRRGLAAGLPGRQARSRRGCEGQVGNQDVAKGGRSNRGGNKRLRFG
jgi:hypothetical protein